MDLPRRWAIVWLQTACSTIKYLPAMLVFHLLSLCWNVAEYVWSRNIPPCSLFLTAARTNIGLGPPAGTVCRSLRNGFGHRIGCDSISFSFFEHKMKAGQTPVWSLPSVILSESKTSSGSPPFRVIFYYADMIIKNCSDLNSLLELNVWNEIYLYNIDGLSLW